MTQRTGSTRFACGGPRFDPWHNTFLQAPVDAGLLIIPADISNSLNWLPINVGNNLIDYTENSVSLLVPVIVKSRFTV